MKVKSRTKDGKTHRYWSIVESVRVHGGCIIHRPLLYLGELNDVQALDLRPHPWEFVLYFDI
ncbi:MAG: hypothetical protein NTX50_07520 [Candidatus Sumerlaeota bacterium]|nr:hypothetical protein [Candidatus Sumerlaeota bacterium]